MTTRRHSVTEKRHGSGRLSNHARTVAQPFAADVVYGPDLSDIDFGNSVRCLHSHRDGRCYVYFIAGDGSPIKIGMSNAPYERLAALQTGHWMKLSIIAKVEGGAALETRLHRKFAASRMAGEWFARTPELDRYIKWVQRRHGIPLPYHVPLIDMGARRLSGGAPSQAEGGIIA